MTRTAIKPNPRVMSGSVGATPILFNLDDRQLHSLNETGKVCWDLLSEADSIEHLIALVGDAYGLELSLIHI